MLPKVEACLTALDGGVRKAHIIDGRQIMPCCLKSSPIAASGPKSWRISYWLYPCLPPCGGGYKERGFGIPPPPSPTEREGYKGLPLT